jgi:hypothetical protein
MENVDHQTEEVLQQLLLQIYVTQGWQVLFLEQDHGIGHVAEAMEEVQQIVQPVKLLLQQTDNVDYQTEAPLISRLPAVFAALATRIVFLVQVLGIGYVMEATADQMIPVLPIRD